MTKDEAKKITLSKEFEFLWGIIVDELYANGFEVIEIVLPDEYIDKIIEKEKRT